MPAKELPNRSTKQVDGSPPVIENTKLPKMSENAVARPKLIRGKVVRMATDPPQGKGGKNRMDPVPTKITTVEAIDHEYPPQVESNGSKKKFLKQRSEAYLRLRLRVEDREISVVEAHKVDGPLTMPDMIDGNLVYEVTLGSNRIAAGSITDVGVNRSFPNPQGVPGQEGHYFVELPIYEFNVRIPKENISPSALPKAEISVYRTKGMISQAAGDKPLRSQFGSELREVARLKGIPVKKLTKPIQTEINRLFR